MYVPSPARELIPPVGLTAGICCPVEVQDKRVGLFFKYRRVPGSRRSSEVLICLHLIELGKRVRYLGPIPFLIDTGAQATIVPRSILGRQRAFRSVRLPHVAVEGVTGGIVIGYRQLVALALIPPQLGVEPVSFGELEVVVVEDWGSDYGILGLDALRGVVMVCDGEHVCFWPHRGRPSPQ